jgi:glutathione S-transferase
VSAYGLGSVFDGLIGAGISPQSALAARMQNAAHQQSALAQYQAFQNGLANGSMVDLLNRGHAQVLAAAQNSYGAGISNRAELTAEEQVFVARVKRHMAILEAHLAEGTNNHIPGEGK